VLRLLGVVFILIEKLVTYACILVAALPYIYFVATRPVVLGNPPQSYLSYVIWSVFRWLLGTPVWPALFYLLYLVHCFVYDQALSYQTFAGLSVVMMLVGMLGYGWSKLSNWSQIAEYSQSVLTAQLDVLTAAAFLLVFCSLLRTFSLMKRLGKAKHPRRVIFSEIPRIVMDLICILPSLIILCTLWRVNFFFRKIKSPVPLQTTASPFLPHKPNRPYWAQRRILLQQTWEVLLDIFPYALSIPVWLTVYRAKPLWKEVSSEVPSEGNLLNSDPFDINHRRKVCIAYFKEFLLDLPAFLTAICLFVTVYRAGAVFASLALPSPFRASQSPRANLSHLAADLRLRRSCLYTALASVLLDGLACVLFLSVVTTRAYRVPVAVREMLHELRTTPSPKFPASVSPVASVAFRHVRLVLSETPTVLCGLVAALSWRAPFVWRRLLTHSTASATTPKHTPALLVYHAKALVPDVVCLGLLFPLGLTLYRVPRVVSVWRASLVRAIQSPEHAHVTQWQLHKSIVHEFLGLCADLPYLVPLLAMTCLPRGLVLWADLWVARQRVICHNEKLASHHVALSAVLRALICEHVVKTLCDVVCLPLLVLCLSLAYPAPALLAELRLFDRASTVLSPQPARLLSAGRTRFHNHRVIATRAGLVLSHLPVVVLTPVLLLSGLRTQATWRVLRGSERSASAKTHALYQQVAKLMLDMPCLVLGGVLLFLAPFRVPALLSRLYRRRERARPRPRSLDPPPTEPPGSAADCGVSGDGPFTGHALVVAEVGRALCDLPDLLLALALCLCVWRAPFFLRDLFWHSHRRGSVFTAARAKATIREHTCKLLLDGPAGATLLFLSFLAYPLPTVLATAARLQVAREGAGRDGYATHRLVSGGVVHFPWI
jgi:hypothetical protein